MEALDEKDVEVLAGIFELLAAWNDEDDIVSQSQQNSNDPPAS